MRPASAAEQRRPPPPNFLADTSSDEELARDLRAAEQQERAVSWAAWRERTELLAQRRAPRVFMPGEWIGIADVLLGRDGTDRALAPQRQAAAAAAAHQLQHALDGLIADTIALLAPGIAAVAVAESAMERAAAATLLRVARRWTTRRAAAARVAATAAATTLQRFARGRAVRRDDAAPTAAGSTEQACGAASTKGHENTEDGMVETSASGQLFGALPADTISTSYPHPFTSPEEAAAFTLLHNATFPPAEELEEVCAEYQSLRLVRTVFGDVLRVRCSVTGVDFDVGLSCFCLIESKATVSPAWGVPPRFPWVPDPARLQARPPQYLRSLPGGGFLRELEPQWSLAELALRSQLLATLGEPPAPPAAGEEPSLEHTAAVCAYNAAYWAAWRDHPTLPPRVLGVTVWAQAEEAAKFAAAAAACAEAARDLRTRAADAARAAAIEAEMADVEARLEAAEERAYDAAVLRAHAEALRDGGVAHQANVLDAEANALDAESGLLASVAR